MITLLAAAVVFCLMTWIVAECLSLLWDGLKLLYRAIFK